MIAIIDYGMGNLRSVNKALQNMDIETIITDDKEIIKQSNGLILPGVGAFGEAVNNLKDRELFNPIKDFINSGRPFLGICLGLQLLFERSEEQNDVEGFKIFKGEVKRFSHSLKIPHIGWNQVNDVKNIKMLNGIDEGDYFYFVHSFYVEPLENIAATTTEYGINFVSSVNRDNVFACQFHPEKSQDKGLKIIKNFSEMVK